MGTKLPIPSIGGAPVKHLYDLWQQQSVDTALFAPLAAGKGRGPPLFVVNVASQEYSKVVDRSRLPEGTLWIDCVFKDSGRVLSFFAKQARGLMARYCAVSNVSTPEQLKEFDLEGYKFQPTESTGTVYVFGRPKPPPMAAAKTKGNTTPRMRKSETVSKLIEPKVVAAKEIKKLAKRDAQESDEDAGAGGGGSGVSPRASKRLRSSSSRK
jgi:hypothetical protein